MVNRPRKFPIIRTIVQALEVVTATAVAMTAISLLEPHISFGPTGLREGIVDGCKLLALLSVARFCPGALGSSEG